MNNEDLHALLSRELSDEEIVSALLDLTLRSASPDVADAVRVCALPAWFDAELLSLLTGKDQQEAAALVERIADYSFVLPRKGGGYVFHEATRTRLLDWWQEPDCQKRFVTLSERLAERYLALAREQGARLNGPDYIDALAMLDASYLNIKAAWEDVVKVGNWEMIKSFPSALASYQSQRGLWKEKRAWAQEGLSACEHLGDQTGWADMKITLGNAYRNLPTGDRVANLEKAIQCYQEALRVYTPEAAPFDYAMTQNNLGAAYADLPTGDRAANLEKAIQCYQEALRFRTPEVAPFEYARTQNNLGNAYWNLPMGDRAVNLEKAIQCYQEALRFRTPEAASFEYARTQNNLGAAYSALDRYQEAIDAYQKAIEADPKYALPHDNLAGEYLKLGRLDEAEAEFLERIRLSPDDALYGEVSLGCIAFHKGEVNAAQDYFERALAIWDTARQHRVQSNFSLLENKALALLGVGRPQEAIATLHRALEQRLPTDTIDLYRYDLLATAPESLRGLEEFVSLLRQAAGENDGREPTD